MTQHQKFFFDTHNFDDGAVQEVNEEDLPPIFSEEELEAAKKIAFEQGRKEALEESAQSREQTIALTLKQIQQNFSLLIASEEERNKAYEEEAINLSLTVLIKIVPQLIDQFGIEEIYALIKKALNSREQESDITIEVPDSFAEDIEKRIKADFPNFDEEQLTPYKIIENKALSQADCELSWTDGGAVRNTTELVSVIQKELENLIESKTSGHNNDKNHSQSEEQSIESEQDHLPDQPGETS